MDAGAVRDRLLQLARSAPYDPAAFSLLPAVLAAWHVEYPALKTTCDTMPCPHGDPSAIPADPSTVSVELYLGARSDLKGSLMAFAVKDTRGRCAAGGLVDPDDTHRVPVVFQPIDMRGAAACTAFAAHDRYRGSSPTAGAPTGSPRSTAGSAGSATRSP